MIHKITMTFWKRNVSIMEEMTGMASIPAIMVICYLAALIIKITPLDNRFIPVICGVAGGLLGVVAKYVMIDYPADDILSAVAIGIASGFAATGVNQVFKQLNPTRKREMVTRQVKRSR
ncbi:MAG: phage holin family protein [Bacillota bacterium]|nr:phage holin family protein [Bacillota bacterium]